MRLAVAGLGYVDLPRAVMPAKKGYEVVAYDINPNRIAQLKSGVEITWETTSDALIKIGLTFQRFFQSQQGWESICVK